MSQLKFSDLIDSSVPLSPEEVVALTLAVSDALTQRGLTDIPSDDSILLSSTGQLSLESVNKSDDEDTGDAPITTIAQLAALTRRLLRLEKRGSVDRRKRVPAPLLGTLARALTKTDLPAPSPDQFRESLERFGKPEPTILAAVFWRTARVCMPTRVPQTLLPAVKVESALAHRAADDRRQNVLPPSELRRYLRETERELFEARTFPAFPDRRRAPLSVQSAAVPEEVAPPTPAPTRTPPFYSTRVWRITAGVAATIIGAVLGTVMAFLLAGKVNPSKNQVALNTDAAAAVVTTAGASQAPANAALSAHGGQRPIRTERTVQPMLLAAAVGADVFSPSFAPPGPRGRTILFHAGREAAPLMRASVSDSGKVDRIETLLDDGAANYHVTMSPDGTRIAYDSDREGVRGVYVANADVGSPHRISGSGYAAVPSWSPDGRRVAFVRAEPGRRRVFNIWFADVRSGQLQRVTSHTHGQPWGASWFPDGDRLAYSLEDRLMVADLRTGLARGYRSPREGHLVRTPAVSPDGRRIVFQVQRDGVWLLDVEHARMRRILADETAEEFVWEPNGDAIAYHARKAGSYGLWRLALNSSGS